MQQEKKENGIKIRICQRTAALITKYLFDRGKLTTNHSATNIAKQKSKLNIEINSHQVTEMTCKF